MTDAGERRVCGTASAGDDLIRMGQLDHRPKRRGHGAVFRLREIDRPFGLPILDGAREYEMRVDRPEGPGRLRVLRGPDRDLEAPKILALLSKDHHDVIGRACGERYGEEIRGLRAGPLLVPANVDRLSVGREPVELEPFAGPGQSLFTHVAASLSASVVRHVVATFDRRSR